jgi:hypothetical protein
MPGFFIPGGRHHYKKKEPAGAGSFGKQGVGKIYLSCNFSKIFLASWRWKLSGFEATTTN